MIDTDKYEGHTEGPWELILNYEEGWDNTWEGNVHLFTTLGIGIDKKSLSVTDAQLIADAPLLLEEVKRLRGVVAKVWDLMQNSNYEEREMFFWGFDKKNTGWIKRYEELAMKELNWDWCDELKGEEG